ncbi:hypothetical protein [Niastella sp. OAS944]|uniref:hypothetical protein n=1 Tax=Niastella sp. OAS944 TaxID=2664089 RepID=UPI0034863D25|nr:hypothetical protein [Chitinophagaceae bacterium OAS944]
MIRPLLVIYHILLIVCFVTGVVCTRRLKWTFSPMKLLPWFIFLTMITELMGWWWAEQFGNNHKVYNIYQVVQFGFWSFILSSLIANKRVIQLLAGLSFTFIAFAILNIAFIQGMAHFNTLNYFTGAIIVSFFSGYSLSELFKKAINESPFKMPAFWIASSMLVLNSCMIPLILPATLNMRFTFAESRILFSLIMLVNYISYTMITIAFLNYHKNNKPSPL